MPKRIGLDKIENRQEEIFKTLNTRQAKVRYLDIFKTRNTKQTKVWKSLEQTVEHFKTWNTKQAEVRQS
jgi:hypothetical protein